MTDPLTTLSALLEDSGLSIVEMAGVLGRDERTLRRWLAQEMPIPDSTGDQLQRLRITGITRTTIKLEYRR